MTGKVTVDYEASCSIVEGIRGGSPFVTPNDLLSNCIKAKQGINIRQDVQTEVQEMGDFLETPLAQKMAMDLGLTNLETNIPYAVTHPELPLNGSIDAKAFASNILVKHDGNRIFTENKEDILLNGSGIIEIKTTAHYPPDEDGFPPLWRGVTQAKSLMACTDYSWALVGVLYRSTFYKYYVMRRDHIFEKELTTLIQDFNRRIQEEDYYPPVTTSDAAKVYKKVEDGEIHSLSKDDSYKLTRLLSIKEQKKELKKEEDELTLAIQKEMKEATLGRNDQYEVTWGWRNYKAQPEKIVPAKEGYTIRSGLTIKRLNDEEKL